MSQNITFKVTPDGWGQWFGKLTVSNIQSATVEKYLGVMFTSPVKMGNADFNPSMTPWVDNSVAVGSAEVGPLTFQIAAKLEFLKPYTFKGNEALTFYFNSPQGVLPKDPTKIIESFVLLADPVGTVNIKCAASPDPALVDSLQVVTFTAGSLVYFTTMTPGQNLPFPIFPCTYTVTADELTNRNETVVATARVNPVSITVTNGESTDLNVIYSKVDKYSAIDVTVGNLSPLEREQVHVKLVRAGATLDDTWSPNHAVGFRRLPSSGTIDVSVGTTVNNVQYSCNPKSVSVSVSQFKVDFPKADKVGPIDTHGFVTLPIEVTTDLKLTANINVRLVGVSPVNLIYNQQVTTKTGTTPVAVPVFPAHYTVQLSNFVQDYTVYVVKASPTLTVTPDGKTKLKVTITRGASLKVPGFPSFLSFGGISKLALKDKDTFVNEPDFVNARASSVFKYAGTGGNGNPEDYLVSDTATVAAVHFAYNVGNTLKQPVLPLMVSYTCNLSGSGGVQNLTQPGVDTLAHTFGNLILSLTEANKAIQEYPVNAVGFIVNPDFIGACQQNKLTKDSPVIFAKDLQAALNERKVTDPIPDDIKNSKTLHGYVQAVNWLVRTISSKFKFPVPFGWQVNLWGVGSSLWIYGKDDPAKIAKEMSDYAKAIGVFDSPYCPDFLAVDRYEGDDFTSRGYPKGYCYGPREWPRFYDLCEALSENLLIPVMPWQIPSSHTPLVKDLVDDLDKEHWGTGGSFLLGDPGVNSHYSNINPKILAIQFGIQDMGEGVTAMFKRDETFDWTNPVYPNFPLRGIFAVLLGGGEATGIASDIGNAGPFVLDKLGAYMKNPIPLDNLHPTSADNY